MLNNLSSSYAGIIQMHVGCWAHCHKERLNVQTNNILDCAFLDAFIYLFILQHQILNAINYHKRLVFRHFQTSKKRYQLLFHLIIRKKY